MAKKKTDQPAEAETTEATGGKEARGEAQPKTARWKQPDYTGPLSADQAMWRRRNLRTKGAK